MERILSGYERAGRRDIYNALKSQYTEVFLDLEIFPVSTVIRRLDISVPEEPIRKFLEKYYPRVGGEVAYIYRDDLVKQKSEQDDWINIFENDIDDWLRYHAASKVTQITETTKDYIRQLLLSAEEEGLGVPEIAKDLRYQMKNISKSRSMTIARTEITTASSIGADKGIRSTGVRVKKFWLSSGLDGVRESHQYAQQTSYAANGIDQDSNFSNGLLFPRAPGGPAHEVINCRCTCIYKPV